jgi:hypothetical protein
MTITQLKKSVERFAQKLQSEGFTTEINTFRVKNAYNANRFGGSKVHLHVSKGNYYYHCTFVAGGWGSIERNTFSSDSWKVMKQQASKAIADDFKRYSDMHQ